MSDKKPFACPDCDGLTRRDFLKGVGGVAAAAAAAPLLATARPAVAQNGSDSLVTQLYSSLKAEQKNAVCFGWDHPKRLMVGNNWQIVPQTIGDFYTPEQQELIMAVFKSAHSEEWVPKRLQQLKDDAGGIGKYSIAMFGTPGTKQFEWVMTGRHLTLRVDGNSEPGVAFGGPIFYGHAAQGANEKPDHPGNVYWYQAVRANEFFKALDGKQQEKALVLGEVPPDTAATLVSAPEGQRPGIHVGDLSKDQKELALKVMMDLIAPMRKEDVHEAHEYVTKNGGLDSLNFAFYKQQDIGDDRVWDVWRVEGPSMVWYFRGAPHVHTWVYIHDGTKKGTPTGTGG
jgi:hypothetical protein